MCDEKHARINDEFCHVKEDVKTNTADIKSIDRKITSTLIFSIVTLATLLIYVILKLF